MSRLNNEQDAGQTGLEEHGRRDPGGADESSGAVYDALAELFLGEGERAEGSGGGEPSARVDSLAEESSSPPAPGARGDETPVPPASVAGEDPGRASEVEAVVLGHLPVLASAWVSQYARSLASEGRVVALLRVSKGRAFLDLYGVEADAPERCATLGEAIARAGELRPLWLVRVDEPDEPRLLEAEGLGRVTLLTGADQAAVIASYRALKSIAGMEDEAGGRPEVGITIMGSDETAAADASAKLSGAARTFLGRELPVRATVPQITPGRSVQVFDGAAPEDVSSLVRAIRAGGADRQVKEAPERAALRPEIVTRGQRLERWAHPAREPVAGATPAPPGAVAGETPAPPGAVAGETPALSRTGVAIEGLVPIRPRCPYHPEIELSVGTDGALHLVARADDAAELGEAVTKLVATRAWAGLHQELLVMAEPKLAPGGENPATVHLVTANARAARRLLDTDVRVHALAPDGPGRAIALN